MRRAKAIGILIVLMTLMPTSALGSSVAAESLQVVSGPRLGQVVAQGVRSGTGACSFAGSAPLVQESGGWIAMTVGDDCRVTVAAAWNGTLGDGPAAYAAVADELAAQESPAPTSQGGAVAPATACKTGKQLFFTYGFGGAALDKLTYLWASLTYCYNDTYVWGTSTSGSGCAGQGEAGWNWVVDQCVVTSQSLSQSTSSVWYEDRGNYHCDPPGGLPCSLSDPDGYFHRLFARVTAYPGGRSTCTNHWDGHIVLGPEMQILSGCP